MASHEFSVLLKSKFRGCMIGALVGDCLGIPFEFKDYEWKVDSIRILLPSKHKLGEFMTNVISEEPTEETKELHHTDDTRMTMNIASSLVEKGEIDAKDLAEKFVHDYFHQTRGRGYGTHVRAVFRKLKASEFEDVFLPAKEQFNGQGSFGNGAAMRISPIALFGDIRGDEYMTNAAKECSLITHYHVNGYRGAILQCFAVNAALRLDPSEEFDPINFICSLLEKMEQIETEKTKPYCESLENMKKIFVEKRDEYVTSEEIAQSLGNGDDVSALKSVPTAIFSFLRGMKPITNKDLPRFVPTAVFSFLKGTEKHYFESDNPFMRTLYFAISVGGDTDTIGSMAGAIAGAYYGEDVIPEVVQKRCEGIHDIISLSDKLFDVTYKEK